MARLAGFALLLVVLGLVAVNVSYVPDLMRVRSEVAEFRERRRDIWRQREEVNAKIKERQIELGKAAQDSTADLSGQAMVSAQNFGKRLDVLAAAESRINKRIRSRERTIDALRNKLLAFNVPLVVLGIGLGIVIARRRGTAA